MKNKILFGFIALVMSLFVAGCSDDDYSVNKTPLLTDGSVKTGSADVTATSATFHGTVDGLESQSASAYIVGFNYGDAADNLSEKVAGNSGAAFDAFVSGHPGQVVYYQAYVTLQGRVTYKGEVKSAVLTDAQAITGSVKDLTANKVVLMASLDKAPADAESGIVISGVDGTEKIRAGVRKQAAKGSDNYEVAVDGLLPNTTYYYTAYLDLGEGVVYGEEKSFTTPAAEFDPDNDLVDLGLSCKWAKYNVGATKASDLGGLFGFGDMTGFNTSFNLEDYASADIYKTSLDVANKVYGSWVTMPTIDEFEELFNECTKEWTTEEGVAGYKLTGPNGNSIFLPAAGSRTQATISGIGTLGLYLSGSINASDNRFAMAYGFDQNADRRTTTPVYQALAIRPVSVAKNVKLKKENLVGKTFEIDLRLDGSHYKFEGPVYYYGSDDSWATVTNNQPVVGNSWCWNPAFKGSEWTVGGTADDDNGQKNSQGSMTFNEDGTVKIDQYKTDGTHAEVTGKYTLDENKKTITLDVQPLVPANFIGEIVPVENTEIRILSLTDESMQLGFTRASDNQYESVNYVTSDVKNGYPVTMFAAGEEGEWDQGKCTIKGGNNCLGHYTMTYTASRPHRNGQVYCLDFQGFAAKYPKALIRIDAIKADGREIPFDANKFRYGDIESNGNYRIELFNVYGKTGQDSPFRQGGGQVSGGESALDFNNTLEVDFTVVSNTSDGTGVYTPNLVTFNPSWGGTQGYNEGAAFKVVLDDGYYKVENNQFDITYHGDHADGSIMTYVEVADLYGLFPGTHSTLDALYLDGNSVSYDKSKVIDSNENPKYRLELWNCYGATKEKGCAFGTPDGDVIKGLAFKKSIEVKFTVNSLFAQPQW